MRDRIIEACKRHPWMAVVQSVTAAALVFVATALYNMNRELGELKGSVATLSTEVQALRDARQRDLERGRNSNFNITEPPARSRR